MTFQYLPSNVPFPSPNQIPHIPSDSLNTSACLHVPTSQPNINSTEPHSYSNIQSNYCPPHPLPSIQPNIHNGTGGPYPSYLRPTPNFMSQHSLQYNTAVLPRLQPPPVLSHTPILTAE